MQKFVFNSNPSPKRRPEGRADIKRHDKRQRTGADSYVPRPSSGGQSHRVTPPPHAVIPPMSPYPSYVWDIPVDELDALARTLDEWKEAVDLRRSMKALSGWSTNGEQNFRDAVPGTIIEVVHVEALGSTLKNPLGSINRGSTAYGKVFHPPHPNLVLSRHLDVNGHKAITMVECGTYGGRASKLFRESDDKDALAFLVSANRPRTEEIPKEARVFEIDTFKNWMETPNKKAFTMLDCRKVKQVHCNVPMIVRGRIKDGDRKDLAELVSTHIAGGLSELRTGSFKVSTPKVPLSSSITTQGSIECSCDCHKETSSKSASVEETQRTSVQSTSVEETQSEVARRDSRLGNAVEKTAHKDIGEHASGNANATDNTKGRQGTMTGLANNMSTSADFDRAGALLGSSFEAWSRPRGVKRSLPSEGVWDDLHPPPVKQA